MELALVWYILLNLAIFGSVVLFVRAARVRVTPNERQDLEENALVSADWERVRRERCLPTRCPRLMGQPPRPRKDVTCEICAATYLEARLQRLLEGPLAPEPAAPEPTDHSTSGGAILSAHPGSPAARHPVTRRGELIGLDPPMPGPHGSRGRRARGFVPVGVYWAVVRFCLGIAMVAAGAAVAAFGGMLWLIIPGFALIVIGLGLIASGAI